MKTPSLPQRRAVPTPNRKQWLALKPMRNPQLQWSEEESGVVLKIVRARNWKTRLLNLLVPLPDEHTVALDKIGTDVWRLLDGKRDIGQIARQLARDYQIENREAELSLQQFFKELGRRGYIGFHVDDAAMLPKRPK